MLSHLLYSRRRLCLLLLFLSLLLLWVRTWCPQVGERSKVSDRGLEKQNIISNRLSETLGIVTHSSRSEP